MAAVTTSGATDDSESCVLCSSRYNRIRPSFCQCKHCSIPLCLNCMKEHHDEILQTVIQLSHQYNELKELVQTKQKMILDETTQTIDDVNHYFDTYITELREIQLKIIHDLQVTKQDAQNGVVRMDSDLQSLSIDIKALAKESIVQTTKMKTLSTEMKRIEEQLNTYRMIKTEKLIKTKPEFSIKFDCSSIPTETLCSPGIQTSRICETETKEASSMMNTSDLLHQTLVVQEHLTNQAEEHNYVPAEVENWWIFNEHHDDDDDDNDDDDDDENYIRDSHISTSYIVDRMASDGENVLYTSYEDEDPDLIAYCLMDDKYGNADKYREWKQSRIEDMIWWNSIQKFVCATNDAIYSVDYINGRFKILCVLRDNYLHIGIAANANRFFLHYTVDDEDTNEIEVYTTNFELVKVIDVRNQKYLSTSSSICVTNHILASICTRMQHNRQVFQVNFFDMNMNELSWIRLGGCKDSIEIRSDGNELFFISTGQRKLHIVSPNKRKKTLNLKNDSDCIAVLGNQRIAISCGRADIELITY